MNGETCLIIRDLKAGCSIDEVSQLYNKTSGHIRNLASKHHISVAKPKKDYIDYRDDIYIRNDIPMPQEGFQAAKLSGLAKCNDAWAKKVGCQRISEHRAGRENVNINNSQGLRFPVYKKGY